MSEGGNTPPARAPTAPHSVIRPLVINSSFEFRHSSLPITLSPDLIYILFLFLLGACIGSFLNVVVWRLPRGESLVTPPSHCPNCDKLLPWYDNIPILGWIK